MLANQHAHSCREAMIALEGKTVYGVNGQIYPCVPGSVFMFDPGMPHDQGYPSWSPATTHLWLFFMQNKAMARLMIVHQGRMHIRGNIHCLLDLKDTALWQQNCALAMYPGRPPELIRLHLLAALADIVAALVGEGYRDTADDPQHRFQQEKIETICHHIRETGGADAHLDHLAQIAGYSKFHFLRLFQRHTGQTIHAYVNQARLLKVKVLLARGLALKAISAELGFSCPAAFSRWYGSFR